MLKNHPTACARKRAQRAIFSNFNRLSRSREKFERLAFKNELSNGSNIFKQASLLDSL